MEYPSLKKINVLVKVTAGVTDKETRWVKDSPFKICACYLGCKLTGLSDREIGGFFDINRKYMRSQVKSYAVQLLMDPECKSMMETIEAAYKELDQIHA